MKLIGLAMIALLTTAIAPAPSPRNLEVTGITKPSEELKLPFSAPGVVRTEHVKEGDAIKSGQPLLSQDDEVEQKDLELLELKANSKARIQAAEADLRAKTSEYNRVKKIFDSGGGNESEVETAEAEMILRQKQLDVAKEDQQEAKIKAAQQTAKLARMKVNAPFDGIVEKIVIHGGEWFDPQRGEGAIVVVRNDPLYIEVRDLNAAQVAMLQKGQKLLVRHTDDADKKENWQEAEVFFISPVADAGSQTRLFKLKMSNPSGRASGLEVKIKLPDNLASAANGAGDASNLASGK